MLRVARAKTKKFKEYQRCLQLSTDKVRTLISGPKSRSEVFAFPGGWRHCLAHRTHVDCKPVDHIAASDDSMSDRTIDCRQAAVDSAEVSRDSAAFLLVDYARRSSDESSINDWL